MALAEDTRVEIDPVGSLLDPGTFRPLRSAVTDGVRAGAGRVGGRPIFVWQQDGSHRGGSLGAAGGETIARTFTLAARAGAPVVGFPQSGGARVGEGTAALTAYGAIFRAIARSRKPVLSVVSGACAGGAAYGCALGDLTIAAGDDARLFLTGPRVVSEVTREEVTQDDLGGMKVQGANGVVHLIGTDVIDATLAAREALLLLDGHEAPSREPLAGDPGAVLPESSRQVYDVRDVIGRVLDRTPGFASGAPALLELAPRWARNLVVGLGRIEGRPVGVIANQPRHLGGTLDVGAAQKGAWFVELCDRHDLPLVVLVDTPGFLPGLRQERDGIIRHGASFLRAFARARVPRVTITLRQAYGGAHIVMNSRDLGADLALAWNGARIGVMGARQAVKLTERRALADGADPLDLETAYELEHLDVAASARGGYVDEVIAPSETRDRLAMAFGAFGP